MPALETTALDDPALVRETLALGARDFLGMAGTDPVDLAAVVARLPDQ